MLLNPVRSRIIQYLSMHQTATPGELAEHITDVPRTTLYRHLKVLTKSDVIVVVDENRVRGSVERTYSLNLTTISKENTKENATRNAFGFLMKIYADFERYFSDPEADPNEDRIFLNHSVLMMSDEEFDMFLSEVGGIMKKYMQQEPSAKKKPRNLSIISAPNVESK